MTFEIRYEFTTYGDSIIKIVSTTGESRMSNFSPLCSGPFAIFLQNGYCGTEYNRPERLSQQSPGQRPGIDVSSSLRRIRNVCIGNGC